MLYLKTHDALTSNVLILLTLLRTTTNLFSWMTLRSCVGSSHLQCTVVEQTSSSGGADRPVDRFSVSWVRLLQSWGQGLRRGYFQSPVGLMSGCRGVVCLASRALSGPADYDDYAAWRHPHSTPTSTAVTTTGFQSHLNIHIGSWGFMVRYNCGGPGHYKYCIYWHARNWIGRDCQDRAACLSAARCLCLRGHLLSLGLISSRRSPVQILLYHPWIYHSIPSLIYFAPFVSVIG